MERTRGMTITTTQGGRDMSQKGEIVGGGLLPCRTCPWRIDQDSSVIPGYCQDKAEGLRRTVGRGDDFRQVMACHNSTDKKMIPCKGYLAQEGYSNLNVRLLAIKGVIPNPAAVANACEDEGIEMEPDYETVLAKLSA
jgi:Family of unknown function (DUF6283)